MKKYFAKWLTVEGTINKGDMFYHPFSKTNMYSLGEDWVGTDCKLIKLFLCSRDIQVGDKADLFKILAEISSEATWIKDGDEFNENEVKLYWQPGGHGGETWNLVSIDHLPIDFIKETKPDLVAKIICPHCKHFH